MKFMRAFLVQFRQMVSWQLALCAVLSAVMMELSVAGMIADFLSGKAACTVWELANSTGTNMLTLFVLPTLPFAMSLSQDWESHAMPYWVVREGVVRYTTSKLLASSLAGFLTVGLGLSLFVLINGAYMPWYHSCTSADYEALFEDGRIAVGWTCYILHMSLSGALIGALGMFMSILVPNRFVAISAPLAIHLTILRVIPAHLISPISIWHPVNWVESIHYTAAPGLTLLGKFLLAGGFCMLMCLAGCVCMKRRMEHG